MDRIAITIRTDNEAFELSPSNEIARILHELADKFAAHGFIEGKLRDMNGNTVGGVVIY